MMSEALLKPRVTTNLAMLKVKIPIALHELIKAYMKHARFECEQDFIEQALNFLFESDKSFKNYKNK